jgi:CRISPR system Cascade subunit CasE
MSDAINMVQISVDSRKLTKWALERRLNAEDTGYVVHALMCDAYGDLRPQPFTVEEKMGVVKVLGYMSCSDVDLKKTMEETAEPEVAACILSVVSKTMPSHWTKGQRFRFRLRVAPTRQGRHKDGGRFEKDALSFETGGSSRQESYIKWLTQKFENAATIEDCEMTAFRIMKACRRAIISETGKRPAVATFLPDAQFEGTLRVDSDADFVKLLRTGIGRHKAFGFGALMLRPLRSV